MNISIKLNKFNSYDLSTEEDRDVLNLVLETLKPVIVEIFQEFAFSHDSPQVANQILVHVKKRLFKDSDIKIVMRLPKGERKDIGTILNYVKIKIDKDEIPLPDYIFHMSVITLGKAFIKIK